MLDFDGLPYLDPLADTENEDEPPNTERERNKREAMLRAEQYPQVELTWNTSSKILVNTVLENVEASRNLAQWEERSIEANSRFAPELWAAYQHHRLTGELKYTTIIWSKQEERGHELYAFIKRSGTPKECTMSILITSQDGDAKCFQAKLHSWPLGTWKEIMTPITYEVSVLIVRDVPEHMIVPIRSPGTEAA